jgi:hypothetical protein
MSGWKRSKTYRRRFLRRLIEISENLHRAELSVLELAKLVKEWVEMTTENQVPQVGAAKPQYEQCGVRLAARQLPAEGDTDKAREHRIARDLKIVSLSPEAQDVARGLGWTYQHPLRVAQNHCAISRPRAIVENRTGSVR